MKILHSGQAATTLRARAAPRPTGRRFDAADGASSEASDASATPGMTAAGPASAVSSVDAVMALQAVDGARARATRYGAAMLDRLDDLRVAILGGGSVPAAAAALDEALNGDAAAATDDELQKVLDAIRVRTAVELAKHTRSIT